MFNHRLTPDVSVVEAVLASCAIPGAFPSGRLAVGGTPEPTVQRLVDGGTWANYPTFVFPRRLLRLMGR